MRSKLVTLILVLVLSGLPGLAVDERSGGVVVSASAPASAIGAEVLRVGGNAVDATVATALAMAVTYPRAGNLGGGGFALVRTPDGVAVAVDFREVAPATAHREMYWSDNDDGDPLRSTLGALAVAVPGTVAGLAHLHQKYGSGRLSWAELAEPARRLAEEGIEVTEFLARDLRAHARRLGLFADSRRIFLRDGRFFEAGELLIQADLAATLRRLQVDGPSEFYQGETAARIVAAVRVEGGILERSDLANYQVVERDPLRGRYRGHDVVTMPPPSSGGVALLQMLGMVELLSLDRLTPGSAEHSHVLIEVMRRAFRDRSRYPGDPAFVDVPTDQLLRPDYLRDLLQDIRVDRATPSTSLGLEDRPRSIGRESLETTHLSVVDRAGTVVALTYTLNGNYGSALTAAGTGVLLNNEMDDFTVRPGVPNMFGLVQGEQNAIEPGKRPLSSMTPTIVLRDGQPIIVTGSPGGPMIINTVLQVVLQLVAHGASAPEAVAAPRLHHQWQPDVVQYEAALDVAGWRERLQAMGHRVEPRERPGTIGDASTLVYDLDGGSWIGVADPRSPDAAAVRE